MEEKILIINAGSSSLKFTLYDINGNNQIVNGLIEKIGEGDSGYYLKYNGKKVESKKEINNHSDAVLTMLEQLLENNFIEDIEEIKAVGHRILHGGEKYSDSVLITDEVKQNIKALTPLGPLHHPGELAGIECIEEYLKDVPNIAVFDTAFHQTLSKEKYMYPVPYELYEDYKVRKYGFHGTSHKYITEFMQEKLEKENINLIVCHIGSGVSITAIKDGKSFDTSMGLTPLDGLMMGTRSGSIDPSIIEYINKCTKKSIEDITNILNKKSGLLGICGKNDFRDVEALANNGDEKAILALEMFKNSIIKYIAQYYFELEGDVDAIVFTAGIGENCPSIRKDIVNAISKPLNIRLNEEMNNNIARFLKYSYGEITSDDSSVKVFVVPTDEEYMILKDTYRIYKQNKQKEKPKQLILK